MAEFKIKRVLEIPSAPWLPNVIYLVDTALATPVSALAWRVEVLTTSGGFSDISEIVFGSVAGGSGTLFYSEEDVAGGHLATHAFDGSSSVTNYWRSTSMPSSIGKIYPAVTEIDKVLITIASHTTAPTSIRVMYSNDTMDGVDGTWTLFKEMDALIWTEDSERVTLYKASSTPRPLQIAMTSADGLSIYTTHLSHELSQLLSSSSAAVSVSDIAARDVLVMTDDAFVWVEDATSLPEIDSGGALFMYTITDATFTNLSNPPYRGEMTTEEW